MVNTEPAYPSLSAKTFFKTIFLPCPKIFLNLQETSLSAFLNRVYSISAFSDLVTVISNEYQEL